MSIQQMLLGASGASGYLMDKSLRFRASASAYLNRTPAGAGNRQIYTWNGWVKRGTLGSAQRLFVASDNNFIDDSLNFLAGDTLTFYLYNSSYQAQLVTTQVFRDPSAWYMITVAVDTTQATAANRVKIYVNGSQVTAFSTATYPTQNLNSSGFNTTNPHNIGRYVSGTNYFDGYLAEVNFIDGQALTPSSFGSTNTLTGVWQPAPYTGTYGTNGFYLDFETTASVSALGTDKSGNGNNWTVNNISLTAGVTYDSMTDVPTLTSATAANYAVLNPLRKGTGATLSNANLTWSITANNSVAGSIGAASGKWYWEVTAGSNTYVGIINETASVQNQLAGIVGAFSYSYSATKYSNGGGSGAYGATYTSGDIIGVAFDSDAGTLTFYKNNVSQGVAFTGLSGVLYFPATGSDSGSTATGSINFGQRPFTYTPPTGFVALNTFNLLDSVIVKGNTAMDATLYTGTGATLNVTNSGLMQPDFVWLKGRSSAYNHALFDSIRGANKVLFSNGTSSEQTETAGSLSSFNSDGFTLASGTATHAAVNVTGQTFVAWQWQAGQGTTSSNTNGSITSTVSVNPTAGFSVVTYTGTGANATVGHGLGVAPKMIIVKQRSGSNAWRVYHASLANTQILYLSAVDAATTETTAWNSTTPTSSVFSVGTSIATNANANTYVAYCWSEIDGFSKFGSYTGNGSTDGPFVYTGFRPEFVMFKRTSGISNWGIVDNSRSSYNVCSKVLFPDTSDAELSSGDYANFCDLLSNGFKPKNGATNTNISGSTYIYMAFAENPFKNSLAR